MALEVFSHNVFKIIKKGLLAMKLISTKRLVLLIIFSLLIFIYSVFDVFQSTTISPMIKLIPFLAIGIYALIKERV